MEYNKKVTLPIFLDYQATTRVDPRVLEVMIPYFNQFSNSHSRSHSFGWNAERGVEKSRKYIADLIHADSKEIIFTSGATESNNMAIKGIAHFYRNKGQHIITVCTEHKCVLDSCRSLENEDFKVTYLPVQKNGLIDLLALDEIITNNTILVSIMMVNNEIGVIQPVKEIGLICKNKNVLFHTDAAQAFGKIPINVNDMNIDLMSISSHKIYGPMGIGALYVRRKPRVRLTPLINGGGQERGMRSGTLPTPLVVGFGEAARITQQDMQEESYRIQELSHLLYQQIKTSFPDVVLNGDQENRIPGNLNLSFPYVEGESLIMAIKDLAVSSGSACTSSSLEPSYVIRALNNGYDLEHSSIRFGLGRFTTKEEILYAAHLITKNVGRLRDMSPLLEMVQEGIDLSTVKWDGH
ncbi:IscS subfamily cysteine desulfurase [Wolbachia endosymbiont of Howardula sp.]|uniref:IscS subfamily cysteine desulfurase n=1 Tax=Wolbachia endosymbiont of Howardula sp. TaxID=2916816 RepID=UPI00217D7E25|nr:IscS subfamily cysteine desulfurase [Wolbachia endosymbiont of Howardula sp.]UWI83402.1 IscS subfamily cysteine desulfurase [Wolbachia endosymbiont of Howardula sp.]